MSAVTAAKTANKRRLPPESILAIAVGIVILVIAVFVVVGKLHTNHEIADARVVADQAVDRLAKQDADGLRALADSKFRHDNSAAKLQPLIQPIAKIYGGTQPKVDQTIVANNAKGQHVTFIYKYDRLKVPFYVRVGTGKTPHQSSWHVVNLGANLDESKL